MSPAILSFLTTIAVTLVITIWAASRIRSKGALYNAGGEISGGQNGLAIAGDFLSATTLLGTTALYYKTGIDTLIYWLTPLVGFVLMLVLIAGPLRRLGQYTLGDVMCASLGDERLRAFAGGSAIAIALVYLVAQMVGAGSLISILFDLSFTTSVVTVGVLVTIYVAFGGMLAATWVQIVKAVLLVCAVIAISVFSVSHVGGLAQLYDRAAAVHPAGQGLFAAGGFQMDLFSVLSLSAGFILGMMGLPHILIRFFTVPGEAEARRSIVVAVMLIALVFALLFTVVGPAAIALVMPDPAYAAAEGGLRGGMNMAVLHLANALGGTTAFGIMSGIAFATILAVVAGLAISAASAVSHDLARIARRGRSLTDKQEVRVFRAATAAVVLISVLLALAFQRENVAFLAALAFALAASSNFPVLVLSLYWKRTTATGALAGGFVGLASSIVLIVLSPSVWVKVLGHEQAIFPSDYPTLVTAPLAFFVVIAVSLATAPTVRLAR